MNKIIDNLLSSHIYMAKFPKPISPTTVLGPIRYKEDNFAIMQGCNDFDITFAK
jgi:hypothetical protein